MRIISRTWRTIEINAQPTAGPPGIQEIFRSPRVVCSVETMQKSQQSREKRDRDALDYGHNWNRFNEMLKKCGRPSCPLGPMKTNFPIENQARPEESSGDERFSIKLPVKAGNQLERELSPGQCLVVSPTPPHPQSASKAPSTQRQSSKRERTARRFPDPAATRPGCASARCR